ncbi:GNAT family N-acetyltransferase [Rhodobacterales bacterium HKCCE3408]|nr:GNAT family N-acetyltransferase [Rhodobacterales bacterium HKCCE3408]
MTPAEMAAIHAAAFTRQRPWAEVEFVSLLDDRTTRVIEVDGGFGLLLVVAPEAEIITLAVNPAMQRRGTGRRIVEAMMQEARDAGAATVYLEVAAGNLPARALYAATGFEETGRRLHYYRFPDGGSDDAIVMARAIDGPVP